VLSSIILLSVCDDKIEVNASNPLSHRDRDAAQIEKKVPNKKGKSKIPLAIDRLFRAFIIKAHQKRVSPPNSSSPCV